MTKPAGRLVVSLVFLLAYAPTGVSWTTGHGQAQAAPNAAGGAAGGGGGVTLNTIPLGAVVATGGGHYNPLPIITNGGGRTLVAVAKGSRVQAYVDGQPGSVVDAIPVTQTQPIAGFAGIGTSGSPQFSADQKRVAYIVSLDSGKQAVVVDGTMSPTYPAGNPIRLYFAPVGHHFAYVVGSPNGSNSFVVDDGKAGLIYQQGIASEGFSADGKHFAYVGVSASKGLTPLEVQAGKTQVQNMCVVLDGVEQKHFAKIQRPIFSQDGNHLGFIAGTDQLSVTRAVIDNQEGPAYLGVHDLVLSDDGSRSAYVATKLFPKKVTQGNITRDESYKYEVAVVNGKEDPADDSGNTQIQHLCISHDGQRVAYIEMSYPQGQGSHAVIVDNAKPSQQYGSALSVDISPDGKTLVSIVSGAQGAIILVNGQENGPFSGAFTPAFSKDGGHWACGVSTGDQKWAILADGKTIAVKGVAPETVAFQPGTNQLMMKSPNSHDGIALMFEVKGDVASAADVPTDTVYSPNHQHVVKVLTTGYGTSEAKQKTVIDDQPALATNYTGIENVAVSDDGKHVAYIGSYIGENGKALTHAVYDGTEGPGYFAIKDIALSPDGRHVAYLAYKSNGHGVDAYVVVDGLEGPAFQDALIDGINSAQGMGAYDRYHQVRFEADGSLHFFPVISGQLYRAWYPAAAFNGLPSMAMHEAEKPGPRLVHDFKHPNIFEDQAEAMSFVLAPDETIYGVSDADGKFKHGTIFKVKTDGSGFAVLHDFYGGDDDGQSPTSVLLLPDGSLFGAAGKAFRYDPKSQQFAIVKLDPKDNAPTVLVGSAADGTIVGLSGGFAIVGSGDNIVSMAADGSNYVSFVNTQFGKPPLMYSRIVAAKDRTFFAVSSAEGGRLVKFKSLKDTPTVVHKFVASPTDGNRPDANLVLDNKGNLYGTTAAGGMSQNGVIYKVNADGSNYQVVYNPDQFAFSKVFVAGDDGMLYGIAKEGLLQLAPDGIGKPPTTLVAFDGSNYTNNRGMTNAIFHDGAVYGLHGAAIYKVTLPKGGTGVATAAPTVAINTIQPQPLASEAVAFTDPTGTAVGGPAAGVAPASQQPPGSPPQPGHTGQPLGQQGPPIAQQPPPPAHGQQPAQNRGNDALNKANNAVNQLRGLFGH